MPEVNIDLVRVTIENRILKMLSEIDVPDGGFRVATTFGRRSIVVQIGPEPELMPYGSRTECELDCLRVLEESITPMTRNQIRQALEAAGKLWGESTVACALANLVDERILGNSRKRGGYFFPSRVDPEEHPE